MRPLLLIGPLLVLLLVLPLHTQAESLYRCVARSGAVSYQSQACPVQQRLDRVVDYQPEPVAARARTPSAVSRRQPRRYANGNGGNRMVRAGSASTASQRCRASKAQREATLQRLGLKRTYVQLSALDASVRAACTGY